MLRRVLIVVCMVLVLVGIGAVWFLANRAHQHGNITSAISSVLADTKQAIEHWAGDQLLAVSRGYLNPELSFERIVYEYPATVTLGNVKLVSEGVVFLEIPVMRVTLTEIPKTGQPLVIQSIDMQQPHVRLIRKEDGTLVGFTKLIRRPEDELAKDRQRLSDLFDIRHLGFINGTLEYQLPNRPAMVLDQLAFDLDSTTTDLTTSREPGWYGVDVKLARQGLMQWVLNGRVNIDSVVLEVAKSDLSMELMPEQYSILLPQVQSIVRDHEIRGRLAATTTGTIAFRDFMQTTLAIQIRLTDGGMVFGEYRMPVDSLEINATLTGRELAMPSINYRGMGGTIDMNTTITLGGSFPARMTVKTDGIRLEDLLRTPEGQPPKYAGSINLTGQATGDLQSLHTTAVGDGHIDLRNGRIVEFPIISGLTRATSVVASGSEKNTDRGSADLRWRNDQLFFSKIDLVSGAIAARGEGDVRFDSSINFRLNAGPLERLQGQLGAIGDLLGKVTDQLVSYHVTGTLAEPVVSVRAFGLGSERHSPVTAGHSSSNVD